MYAHNRREAKQTEKKEEEREDRVYTSPVLPQRGDESLYGDTSSVSLSQHLSGSCVLLFLLCYLHICEIKTYVTAFSQTDTQTACSLTNDFGLSIKGLCCVVKWVRGSYTTTFRHYS